MKKSIILSMATGIILSLNSCGGNADPKAYAEAYCNCMKSEGDANGITKDVRDKCFEKVNGEVGKVKKEDIPKFQEHLKETECSGAINN